MTGNPAEPRLPGEDALDLQVMAEWNGRWELMGSRCPRCARHFYPPRALCPNDLTDLPVVPLSRSGHVHAAAQVALGPVGFQAPYWVAWVDLPEHVRVYTILDVQANESPEPGAPVEFAPRVVRTEPYTVLGPVFRLL